MAYEEEHILNSTLNATSREYDTCNLLLQGLNLELPEPLLSEPDYAQIRHERMLRNTQLLSKVSPSLAKEKQREAHPTLNHNTEEKAAICIQKHFRGYLGRKSYLNYLQKYFESEEETRCLIQMKQIEEAELLIENHKLELDISDEYIAMKNRELRKQYYITVIQRAWRKHRSRRNLI